MLAEGNWLNISIKEQTVRTYGLLIVCFLAANVIISLALLAFTVSRFMQKERVVLSQWKQDQEHSTYHPMESSLDDNDYYSTTSG
jgi:hypothetical protein